MPDYHQSFARRAVMLRKHMLPPCCDIAPGAPATALLPISDPDHPVCNGIGTTAAWIAGYRLLDVGDYDDYTVTLTP